MRGTRLLAGLVAVVVGGAALGAPPGSGWQACPRVGSTFEYSCSFSAVDGQAVQIAQYGRLGGLCSEPLNPPDVFTGAEGASVSQGVVVSCYSNDYSEESHDPAAVPFGRHVYISAEPPGGAASSSHLNEEQGTASLAYGLLVVLFAAGYVGGRLR